MNPKAIMMLKTAIHIAARPPIPVEDSREGAFRSRWTERLARMAASFMLCVLSAAPARSAGSDVPQAAEPIDFGDVLRDLPAVAGPIDLGVISCAAQFAPGAAEPGAGSSIDVDLKPIRQVTTNIAPSEGNLPRDYAAEQFSGDGISLGQRSAGEPYEQVFYWQATGFCHRPLYFEQPNLERYGYSRGVWQPALSGAHFFATVPILPYKMVVERPRDCIGRCDAHRPGDHAPWQRPLPPWDRRAALAEAAAIAGLIFLIP